MGRRFCILATAGHIDHGKSALVKALTGVDPDRLAEEKRRGMTIVLGFARLILPGADGTDEPVHVGIVDVPGHERFVRTMVAGATGVDLGLLVVAADDGVMPQTREHVEILDLLGVTTGAITITKADMVPAERIEAVNAQIASLVTPTALRDWPVVPTSVKTRQGLDRLSDILSTLAAQLPPLQESSVFRVAIDRVFPIHGRGTVVTGSALSGKIVPGETLELHPPGLLCKVREVQSHGESVHDAGSGQRAALNLTGLERNDIERGMELATPGYLSKSRYVDARVRMLPRKERPFLTRQRARVSLGTSENMAMLVVIGADRIEPGAEALVQLQFLEPVVASFGQRFILRGYSAQATIGGGTVIRPTSRRDRPTHPETLVSLRRSASADPTERLAEAVRRAGFSPYTPMRLACEIGIEPEEVETLLAQMEREETWTEIGTTRVHQDTLAAIEKRGLAYLNRHHASKPTEPGLSKDRFIGWIDARTAPDLGRAIVNHLVAKGEITELGPYIAHKTFRPKLSGENADLLEALVEEVTRADLDPPEWAKLNSLKTLSKARAKVLADLAKVEPRLTSFAAGRYISSEALGRFKQTVGELGRDGRKFKLADVRDVVGQSRRVVQPLLEYLDRVGFTRRIGDERVLVGEANR